MKHKIIIYYRKLFDLSSIRSSTAKGKTIKECYSEIACRTMYGIAYIPLQAFTTNRLLNITDACAVEYT